MGHPVEIENLSHRYGRTVIYENLNLEFPAGRIYGILGKNGVGKTTLIKILMGFLRPTRGSTPAGTAPSIMTWWGALAWLPRMSWAP